MEVIAKRKEGLIWMYGFTAALSLVFIVLAGVLLSAVSRSNVILGVLFLVLGGAVLVVSVAIIVGFCRMPKEIIAYEKDKLLLPDGERNISELTNVEYRRASARDIQYQWGKITLVFNGETLKYNYVADVVQVHNRLIELMLISKTKDKENIYG